MKECNSNDIEVLTELLAINPNVSGLKTTPDEQTILEKFEANSTVMKFVDDVRLQMNVIGERGKTATLWIQYVKMVSLFRSFIQAERSGNFNLHLSTIIDMLPFFHVCNHFNYAKCAHLYVQDNLNLDLKMDSPEEYRKHVTKGYFTIRRSNKFFSGVSTDMVVEQTMLRSIHCIGGLVHGRGITESVAASWLNTLNCSAYINDDLEEYCLLESSYSEQHKDLRDHNTSRDVKDLDTILKWFIEHPPFPIADAIMSLSTGVTGNLDVNCYNAEYIGLQSYNEIIPSYSHNPDGSITTNEKDFGTLKFTHKLQLIPLSISSGSIKIGQNKFPIDEKILFSRFEKSQPDPSNYQTYFAYELCPFLLSIFESPVIIRTSKDDFFSFFNHTEKPNNINYYVIDGETLLKQISWAINSTYKSVYDQYIYFLRQNYGSQCTVVFDSMMSDLASIKQSEKLLSLPATAVTTEIYFDESKSTTKKKEILFQNQKNKSRFIEQLINVLRANGFMVKVTQLDDINRNIVDEAIFKSNEKDVAVVSGNVDALCILASFTPNNINIYFYTPEKKWYSTSNIQKQYQLLYPYLHVIRAITGCDVTSSFFNVSKKTCLKRFLQNQEKVSQYLDVLTLASSSGQMSEMISAAESIIIMMYNGKAKNLNDLRCQEYSAALKASGKTSFNIATLPPTSAAAANHIYRVYWLVQRWQNNILPSLLWGWHVVSNTLVVPITSSLPPVPENLLSLIVCTCKKGCKGKSCSCIKSGLQCSHLCKQCTDMCTNKGSIPDWQMINEDDMEDSSVLLQPVDELELEDSRLEDESVPGPSGM